MKYRAFGFNIDSDFELPQLLQTEESATTDVYIKRVKFKETDIDFTKSFIGPGELRMCPKGLAYMRITNGNLIEIEVLKEDELSHLYVFIMGTGMGAIIHQRGLLPLHGSCVTDGKRAVLICGDSGAGKSTTASEFLAHGWKLLTDDVAVIKNFENNKPMVQSSYPSQKLWKDSLAKYNDSTNNIHSLYSREDEIKYGVDVSDQFIEGMVPLSLIVRLVATEEYPTNVQLVDGFGKIEQIRYNTYRHQLIEDQQSYFQKVVTLGTTIPMAVAVRRTGEECSTYIYEELIKIIEANRAET